MNAKKAKKLSQSLDKQGSSGYNCRGVKKKTLQREVDNMDKSIEISLLFDFYGELLSKKKREASSLYFNEDLSLSEISEHMGITRQGVSDLIRRSESELYEFEDKLGLYSRFEAINASAEKIRKLSADIAESCDGQTKTKALEILSEAEKIEKLEA